MPGVRMAVVWCPDWPVVAWGVPLDEPAAVLVANRVVATSPAARQEGVQVGQRRRDAQSRCPDLAVLERDLDREVRLFEPVVVALEAFTPRIEITGPGLVGFPTRGPSRFFGGDEALGQQVLDALEPILTRRGGARVGMADGVFAARLAARSVAAREGPVVVPPGRAAAYLAGFGVETLEMPALTDVLARLGLRTLGDFAALPAADVVGRFGREGRLGHRLARGDDDHPPDLRRPAPDLAVTWQFDPPAERIEGCAFVAKMLADELHATLAANGLACIRVAIEAETEHGQTQLRLWRHEGALSAAALADRTRWQLDGWLRQRRGVGGAVGVGGVGGGPGGAAGLPDGRPTAGIVRLTLIPDEVVPATGRQLGFWGGRNERADDVTRVVTRLQAMLGPEAVLVPEYRGGLAPGERITLVSAAAVDLGEDRPAAAPGWVGEPWPGQLPAPSPARVPPDPVPIEVLDPQGLPLGVDGRGELSGLPALVRLPGTVAGPRPGPGPRPGAAARPGSGPWPGSGSRPGIVTRAVTGWAGPWPVDQRWWDPVSHRRRARLQLTLDDGSAHLVTIEHRSWAIEATYD